MSLEPYPNSPFRSETGLSQKLQSYRQVTCKIPSRQLFRQQGALIRRESLLSTTGLLRLAWQ